MGKRGRKAGFKWTPEQKAKFMLSRWGKKAGCDKTGVSEPNSNIVEASKEAIASIPETPQAA